MRRPLPVDDDARADLARSCAPDGPGRRTRRDRHGPAARGAAHLPGPGHRSVPGTEASSRGRFPRIEASPRGRFPGTEASPRGRFPRTQASLRGRFPSLVLPAAPRPTRSGDPHGWGQFTPRAPQPRRGNAQRTVGVFSYPSKGRKRRRRCVVVSATPVADQSPVAEQALSSRARARRRRPRGRTPRRRCRSSRDRCGC